MEDWSASHFLTLHWSCHPWSDLESFSWGIAMSNVECCWWSTLEWIWTISIVDGKFFQLCGILGKFYITILIVHIHGNDTQPEEVKASIKDDGVLPHHILGKFFQLSCLPYLAMSQIDTHSSKWGCLLYSHYFLLCNFSPVVFSSFFYLFYYHQILVRSSKFYNNFESSFKKLIFIFFKILLLIIWF
jgi:hypothetical protein